MPAPYNVQGPPAPMMHHGRRQNPNEYYTYYQHPQHYHPQPAPQYPQHPQWYAPSHYPMQQPQYGRPYHQMPLQHPPQHPMVVSSLPPSQPPLPPQFRPHAASPPIPTAQAYPPPAAPNMQIPPQPRHSPVVQSYEFPTAPTSASTSTPPAASASPDPSSRPTTASSGTAQSESRMPFYPQLPWYSVPKDQFPPRVRRRRRKGRQESHEGEGIQLPTRFDAEQSESGEVASTLSDPALSQTSTLTGNANLETSSTSEQHETNSTQPTTPSSVAAAPKIITTPRISVRAVVPVVPVAPKASPQQNPLNLAGSKSDPESAASVDHVQHDGENTDSDAPPELKVETPAPVPKAPPKSWADLVRTTPQRSSAAQLAAENASSTTSALSSSKTNSLAEVIKAFKVDVDSHPSFLEPRGLVNTGNMCYMNSILQVLLYCIPFYSFLEVVASRAAHSFKSETPTLDAMILFMKEFHVIGSADSADALRRRLKDTQLEQYGDQLTPEYVYDAIKQSPRFSNMRRGHQQDAEEFLGILLEALHEECVSVLRSLSQSPDASDLTSPATESTASVDGGWLEVGPKQKASITRSSGILNSDSPITKIFGGKLRSELRVPGLKNSVTMEPYRPLQLDIGATNVQNIVDALKGLTKSETLHGDFNSPRGPGTAATKQVFIETLPPVLILHLKRFQYDNTGGVQKIWKKIGYPLELTIPKEAFPTQKRAGLSMSGLPKYILTGVVYHHGKNASGGHYTVDVRRQDGAEWIRFDDTVIRRLRAEDVAEAGAEEDPKVLAKALENHKRDASLAGVNNPFESIENEDDGQDDDESGWNKVNGSANKEGSTSNRKWSSVVNASSPPATAGKVTPKRDGVKDKVAYILFYRKVD